jgi:phosphocarrier protein HPr
LSQAQEKSIFLGDEKLPFDQDERKRFVMHKLVEKVKIKNGLGLHARPATAIAKLLQSSRSAVTFSYKKETIDARSVMSILMLAIRRNSSVIITVEGTDAQETMARLLEAFANRFGE